MAVSQPRGGFDNSKSYAPKIKNKAIHVKKVATPGIKALGNPASANRAGSVRPGASTNTKFAPKSNRTSAGYKAGAKKMGNK